MLPGQSHSSCQQPRHSAAKQPIIVHREAPPAPGHSKRGAVHLKKHLGKRRFLFLPAQTGKQQKVSQAISREHVGQTARLHLLSVVFCSAESLHTFCCQTTEQVQHHHVISRTCDPHPAIITATLQRGGGGTKHCFMLTLRT